MPSDSSGQYQAVVRYTGTAVATGGTGAAPTVVTDGVDISDADGFRCILAADSGQTISGGGSIVWWLWDLVLAVWVQNLSITNTLSAPTTPSRYSSTQDYACTFGYGRVYAQLVAVTASSGNITPTVVAGRRNK